MFGINAVSAYIMVIGLLTLLVAVLIWQRQRRQKTVLVWLAAGVVGFLLGSMVPLAAVHLAGYELFKVRQPQEFAGDPGASPMMAEDGSTPDLGLRGPAKSGGRGSRPKADLTTLVRKIELLTGDTALSLSAEQAASLRKNLIGIEKNQAMSDEDAKEKHDQILALFDENQKSRLDAISLPRGSPRGGGRQTAQDQPGDPQQKADANPFTQEVNAKALTSLCERLTADEKLDKNPPTRK